MTQIRAEQKDYQLRRCSPLTSSHREARGKKMFKNILNKHTLGDNK